MNKETILNILKNNYLWIIVFVLAILASIYVLGISEKPKAPIRAVYSNYKEEKRLIAEVEEQKRNLERILEDKQRKNEAAKNATVKDFYKATGSGDMMSEFSPMFENIITMIKQNGLRMKSIKYTSSPTDDNLLKNGGGAYSGYRVDFELVGYYPQFTAFLSDFSLYPYFINISKFEILPYQYDKRILIANVSIMFYSKR